MLARRTHCLLKFGVVEAERENVVKGGHLRVVMVTWAHYVKNSSRLRKNCKRTLSKNRGYKMRGQDAAASIYVLAKRCTRTAHGYRGGTNIVPHGTVDASQLTCSHYA